jgi:hypothetical protein
MFPANTSKLDIAPGGSGAPEVPHRYQTEYSHALDQTLRPNLIGGPGAATTGFASLGHKPPL